MSAFRDLYAHICDSMNNCEPLVAILDASHGVRRMDRPVEGSFVNCICYGRGTRRRVPDHPREPISSMTVTFTPYIRGEEEASTMGDLLLSDIDHYLMRLFAWNLQRTECELPDPGTLLIMSSEFDDFQTEPHFDHLTQAWTQSTRFRFMVVEPSCQPVQPWCVTC